MRPLSRLSAGSFAVSLLAALTALTAAAGTRQGWWDFRSGFTALRAAGWIGIGGLLASTASLLRGRLSVSSRATAALGAVFGAIVVASLGIVFAAAKRAPIIHDITTDTQDPPLFAALLPAREHAPNGSAYGGPEIAKLQLAAYPDLQPARLEAPPASAFAKALQAANRMGWEIVSSDEGAGRIEATATTFWFGFKDDVIVRVRPDGAGSRVDVRSVSRVGRGDVGTNAKRIRAYLRRLRAPA
jgi:hypothetical protein